MRAALAAVLAASALTVPSAAAVLDEGWQPGVAGWTDGPVEHVRTVARSAGTGIGATIHDGHLYVTTFRSFTIYDIADPLAPQEVSHRELGEHLINEQPQTNGDILLLAHDSNALLEIWDVTDKAAPARLTSFRPARANHIWACVHDCAYAYGSHGTILDLADPTDPREVGDWTALVDPPERLHSVAEVAPGVVLTGSAPLHLLDGRHDPANPQPVASAPVALTVPDGLQGASTVGYVDWPWDAKDRVALMTLETPFSGPCNDRSGRLVSYDTAGWQGKGTFAEADRFQITENGPPSEGLAPANALGCSPLGLASHPSFDRHRLVAVGWFEHGTRLFSVDRKGGLEEVGGFVPHAGASAEVLWAADDVLYAVDFHRGVDVLRVDLPTRGRG